MPKTGKHTSITGDVSLGDVHVVYVSVGRDTVHVRPELTLSDMEVRLGHASFTLQQFVEVDVFFNMDAQIAPDFNGEVLDVSLKPLEDGSTETVVGTNRLKQTYIIGFKSDNDSLSDDKTEVITIRFNNSMATGTITVNQSPPAAVTGITWSGGGATANQGNTSSASPAEITTQVATTGTLTITGEAHATYTITHSGGIFSNIPSGTQTTGAGASNVHTINVAAPLTGATTGSLTITNVINTYTLYFDQQANNVPNIVWTSVTGPGSITSGFIAGESLTGVVTVSNGDTHGASTVTVATNSGLTDNVQTETISGGNGTASFNLTGTTASTTFYARVTDASGATSTVVSQAVSRSLPTLTGGNTTITWNDASQPANFTVGGLNSTQLGRLGAGNFTIITTPSGAGSSGAFSFAGSTATSTISSIPVFSNTTGAGLTKTWGARLTIGGYTDEGTYAITKSLRPIWNAGTVAFPNGNPTIAFDATSVAFAIRYDVTEQTIVLSDASASDTDIWGTAGSTNISHTLSGTGTASLSNDPANLDFYAHQSTVNLSGGTTNGGSSTRMDQIRITTS